MKILLKHIRQEIWHRHLFDYLLIFTAAVFFVLTIRLFAGIRSIQIFMFIAFTAFYICWGIYHHILTKTLRLKIMLEYMFIGFAIIFLALTLANY
jgi:hypothetical protein